MLSKHLFSLSLFKQKYAQNKKHCFFFCICFPNRNEIVRSGWAPLIRIFYRTLDCRKSIFQHLVHAFKKIKILSLEKNSWPMSQSAHPKFSLFYNAHLEGWQRKYCTPWKCALFSLVVKYPLELCLLFVASVDLVRSWKSAPLGRHDTRIAAVSRSA